MSPDGTKLLFADITPNFDIVTIDLQTREVTDTIATDRDESMPSWASETNALVYVTNRSGPWEIWLRQPSQADRPLITQDDFATKTPYLMAPMMSPDGKRLIFVRSETERPGVRLWMSAVAGGRPELLTNDEHAEEWAGSWSPDGASFAYLANSRDGGPRMLKKVATTGHATPETLLEGLDTTGIAGPIWSPNGNWILVPNGGMTVISADGETPPRVLGEYSVCTFADDEFLYCIRETFEQRPLVKLDLHGNEVEEVLVFPREVAPTTPFTPGFSLALTPDRSGVTYSVGWPASNLFLLEGLDTVELP